MNTSFPLLAVLDENEQLLMKTVGRSVSSQMMIIFSAIGAVAVLSFLFIYVFRKRLLRRRKHHHHRPEPRAAVTSDTDSSGRSGKRRRRRSHRPTNPTLAETHGLPPLRDEGTPPPGP